MKNLRKIQNREDEILEKNLKEEDEKKKEEERKKKERFDRMMKEIADQRGAVRKKKEAEKIQNKKEEAAFVDEWAKKMKQLEQDELNEKRMTFERNKMLAEYQQMQLNERRRKAEAQFYQLNEDSFKNQLMLQKEDDEFIRYAEGCIRDYHEQGKDITPMLLELKRYKKEKGYIIKTSEGDVETKAIIVDAFKESGKKFTPSWVTEFEGYVNLSTVYEIPFKDNVNNATGASIEDYIADGFQWLGAKVSVSVNVKDGALYPKAMIISEEGKEFDPFADFEE